MNTLHITITKDMVSCPFELWTECVSTKHSRSVSIEIQFFSSWIQFGMAKKPSVMGKMPPKTTAITRTTTTKKKKNLVLTQWIFIFIHFLFLCRRVNAESCWAITISRFSSLNTRFYCPFEGVDSLGVASSLCHCCATIKVTHFKCTIYLIHLIRWLSFIIPCVFHLLSACASTAIKKPRKFLIPKLKYKAKIVFIVWITTEIWSNVQFFFFFVSSFSGWFFFSLLVMLYAGYCDCIEDRTDRMS